jgi:hypothetical protein
MPEHPPLSIYAELDVDLSFYFNLLFTICEDTTSLSCYRHPTPQKQYFIKHHYSLPRRKAIKHKVL